MERDKYVECISFEINNDNMSFYVNDDGLINLASYINNDKNIMTNWNGNFNNQNLQLKNIKQDWLNYVNLSLLENISDIILICDKAKKVLRLSQPYKNTLSILWNQLISYYKNKINILEYYEFLMVKYLNKIDIIITIQRAYQNYYRKSKLKKKYIMQLYNNEFAAKKIQTYWRQYRHRYILVLMKALHEIDIRLCRAHYIRVIKAADTIHMAWSNYLLNQKLRRKVRESYRALGLLREKSARIIQIMWLENQKGWCILPNN